MALLVPYRVIVAAMMEPIYICMIATILIKADYYNSIF